LAENEQPNHALQIARFLLDAGFVDETDWLIAFPDGKPPPTASEFLTSLTKFAFVEETDEVEKKDARDKRCPICIVQYEVKY